MEMKKKLIEVALPLEAINSESAREKSIRHGHPSTLHLWWARRPLATARAVIWSSLVDDPSSHPELFPDDESQRKERERLFDILTKLVKWENSNDEGVLAEAQAEIRKSCGDEKITMLDPFSGGGAIPLEAQRLGLEAHAHDLNPVAVMINKAMIEIPPKFSGQIPVNPESCARMGSCAAIKGAAGLAEDVRYYGTWMQREAYKRIGHLYPKAKLNNGREATVIAWIWARTVKCPNPACGCTIPLAKSFDLSKKRGNESSIDFKFFDGKASYYIVKHKSQREGTIARSGGICPNCGASVEFSYIRTEATEGRMSSDLMAIVAEGERGRLYLSPNDEHYQAAMVEKPEEYPSGTLSGKAQVNVGLYGLKETSQLFTNRQLTALTLYSALVAEAQLQAERDAVAAGMINDGIGLEQGGVGAKAYGEAVGVYLAFGVDKLSDYSSSLCGWMNQPKNEIVGHVFGRQAIPMIWDYAEANIFSNGGGTLSQQLEYVCKVINTCIPICPVDAYAKQFDAQSDNGLRNILVSTDPPYYDNIDYADLSDYFYVWLRQSLKKTYPNLFRTLLAPKAEELVATPYRFDGSVEQAKHFFEEGMSRACYQINRCARPDFPVTIYYAFKQSDTDINENTTSSGWETMLSAVINAGFSITGTWPMRTEKPGRMVSNGSNALASSIVLVCRKRNADARSVTRREFINALHREMRPALEKLQSANIAPVDLAQSAIGPGIGVFSRFKSVLEADGRPMSVRSALQIINQELDAFYNEQEGELDRESRFCVDLFNQYAFNTLKFGDADILARAKNTSVQALVDRGVMYAAKGQVRLLTREELPEQVKSGEECIWLLTQQLARAMEEDGVRGCAKIVMNMYGSNAENAKALAYRLYTICERKNWAQEGFAYNNLVVAWPEIQAMAADMQATRPVQMSLSDLIPND